jgi:redox-sensing transcriptional repressor
MKKERISQLTIDRLSIYLRCVNLLASEGEHTVSSQTLAQRFNLNSAQIRKDLAQFGEFGIRGRGYDIEQLRQHLKTILGLDLHHNIGIMGAGNLGIALADYAGFPGSSFTVVAIFDNDPIKIGKVTKRGVPILDVALLAVEIPARAIDLMVLAVPPATAQAVLAQVAAAGVRAMLNFAPMQLTIPPGVTLKTVDLTISFDSLSHALANNHDGTETIG